MRRLLLLVLLVGFASHQATGQPCRQEQPKDQLRSDLIEGFLWMSVQSQNLTAGKGYVSLYQQTDSVGREVWTFYTSDKAPDPTSGWLPRAYYLLKGYVVLVHEAPYRYQPLDLYQKKQILDCLTAVIGDRITPEPPPRFSAHMTTVMETPFKARFDADGNPVRRSYLYRVHPDIRGCNLGYRPYRICFEKDGSTRII
jgi:hypothetical protein